ncbi:MAG: DMT family transporter, partial [Bdellovibrionota bacterium]
MGPFCAFMSSVTWAFGSAGYSHLSRTYSAFSVSLMRALIALSLFFIWALVSAGSFSTLYGEYRLVSIHTVEWFTVSMFASYGFGDILFLWATRHVGIPTALALASSYPIWTGLFGLVFKNEPLALTQAVGLMMTVAGMVLVILHSPEMPIYSGQSTLKGSRAKGVFLGFAASFFWALNSIAVSEAAAGTNLPVSNTVRMGIVLIMSAAFCLILTPQARLLLPLKEVKKYFWLFAMEAFGGSAFYTYGMTHSTLAVGATLSSLSPVISVPVAWIAGWEKFSP